jgi:cytochrome P450
VRIFNDFTLPDFWQDPISVFQRSFATGDRLQASPDGGIAILGHEALRELGRHPAIDGTPMSAPTEGEPRAVFELLRHAVFAQVGPRHRQLRKAVLAGLNFGAVDTFRDRAECLIRHRLDALGAGPFELVEDLVTQFAAESWCTFMGYDPADSAAVAMEVERLTTQLGFTPDPAKAADADAAAASLLARTQAVLMTARDDGPAQRIAAAVPGCDRAVAAGVVASLLFDAVDTATAGLSGLIAVLLGEPTCHDRLGNSSLREAAIEEALRLATPAVLTVRQAREALVFEGVPIAEGSLVWMWWAAGNADPAAFEAPARFLPGRPNRAMPFGAGAHSCLGHAWVKMLAHVLVRAAFAGESRLAAATDFMWTSGGARRPKSLRVTFG